MKKMNKWIGVLVGGGLIVAIAAGAMAFSFITSASANSNTPQNQSTGIQPPFGGPGYRGNQSDVQAALAKALGISVAELQTAQQKASDAAIQEALKAGLISQNQADEMTLRGGPFRFGLGGRGRTGANSKIDYDALLANALGISVEKLQVAREDARASMLAEAVANGDITQEQADLMKARNALKSYLDPNTLLAGAMGISADELQAYRDQDLTLSQILEKVGKTAAEVRDAQQTAYQAAIAKAVTDHVITQAQADQILARGLKGMGGFGCGPDRGGFGGGHSGGPRFGPGCLGGNRQSAPVATPTAP
jgi:hypothetical protein